MSLDVLTGWLAPWLAGPTGPLAVIGLTLTAVLFLILWLTKRGGGDGGQLRAAQNEAKLHRGDLIQANRDHAVETAALRKEVENLRAVTGGREPPALAEWRQRATDAEARLASEVAGLNQRHKAELEKLGALVGGNMDRTMIAPNTTAARERMETLEQELAAAKAELTAADQSHRAELAALAERLSAEKAAALTAQASRLAEELGQGQSKSGKVDASALSTADVPDTARFPYLDVTAGAGLGNRYVLPYETTTIGRAATCGIVIEEGQASRIHAEIRFDGVHFTLRDNQSTNGTNLNDAPVTAVTPLSFGDVIGIGDLRLRFSCAATDSEDTAFRDKALAAMKRVAPDLELARQR